MSESMDLSLLGGFRFGCLPGCGLCCYTSPAVRPVERERLIQIDPETPFLDRGDGWSMVSSRPNGGACHFLEDSRCRCHEARPATCAEFPVTVHVSSRIQLGLVLSCPGLSLDGLGPWAEGSPSASPPVGLEGELAAARQEVERASPTGNLRRAAEHWRRLERKALRAAGLSRAEDLRSQFYPISDAVIPADLAGTGPFEVDSSASLDELPLAYDAAWGRLSWRPSPGGMEFFELREAGGTRDRREVLPIPLRTPTLEPSARRRLKGYLGYVLAREETLGFAYAAGMSHSGGTRSLAEELGSHLRHVAAQVLRMAVLRHALGGGASGSLPMEAVDLGIRATDMELLDRPTLGLRL